MRGRVAEVVSRASRTLERRFSRETAYFRISNIGCLSQGVKETPVPSTVVASSVPGPPGDPHQFSVASTVPVPMLSTPIFSPSKSLRCTFT